MCGQSFPKTLYWEVPILQKQGDVTASVFRGSSGSKTQSLQWKLLRGVLKGFIKDSQQYRGVLPTKVSCGTLEVAVEPGLGSEFTLQDRKPLPPFD